jgi:hypothetical protein
MIKKIIKHRNDIAKGVLIVTAIYTAMFVNSIRTTYGRNT